MPNLCEGRMDIFIFAQFYYVKEDSVELQGNMLLSTKISPCSKFFVKVTVVAGQYGIEGQVQSVDPMERSFFIKQ